MRKSERRESILQAASELFGSKGYLETKMSDIADACGIAKGTMYEYFSSKDELAAEWCRNFFKEYESCIERLSLIHICAAAVGNIKIVTTYSTSELKRLNCRVIRFPRMI